MHSMTTRKYAKCNCGDFLLYVCSSSISCIVLERLIEFVVVDRNFQCSDAGSVSFDNDND